MNHLQKLIRQLDRLLFVYILAGNIMLIIVFVAVSSLTGLNVIIRLAITLVAAAVFSACVASLAVATASEPIEALWRAILHVSPNAENSAAPDLDKIRVGKELVRSLCNQIYDLASSAPVKNNDSAHAAGIFAHDIMSKFPLPIIALDNQRTVVYVNDAAVTYCKLDEPIGKSLTNLFGATYAAQESIEAWLESVGTTRVTDTHSWERVKLQLSSDSSQLLCDIAGYFNKDNPLGYETVLTIFDKQSSYGDDDAGFGYIATAVHELRTPLTIMRGYIEALDEELEPQLTPEMKDFMRKLSVSGQTLAAFISNILNVARIDEGQYQPKIQGENWSTLLPQFCQELELRATMRHKQLKYDIEPDLPLVAVDRMSIYEAVSNLIDNAIKYSPASDVILIHAHRGKDNTVETVVQDFGIGMPDNVIQHLFTKFYRNHRSRAMVTGSGIGLYLTKAIVTAHGGNVWVNSKEGEGSSFGFSLRAYESLAAEQKEAGEKREITHQAHGWIKNHSLYRR